MELKEAVAMNEEDPRFADWKREHFDYFFANGFYMEDGSWQLGYSDGEKVVTFSDAGISEPQEVVKRPGEKVVGMDVSLVTLTLDEAKVKYQEVVDEHYGKEPVLKTIIIVQVIDGEVLYNITGMTQTLNTINVRVNMKGEVVLHSMQNLIEQM